MQEQKPYLEEETGKKEQVASMFNKISGKYDFLNHLLSFNIDRIWRKKLVKELKKHNPQNILDVATGTADLAIAEVKCKPNKIVGVDISEEMLEIGRKKVIAKNLQGIIDLQLGDAENILLESKTFDAVTVAFGVRNFENIEKGLCEMSRVLKPGGVCLILEFITPKVFPVKQLYNLYFGHILPFFGNNLSEDKLAYSYLTKSVSAFSQRKVLVDKINSCNFKDATFTSLTFGIVGIYKAYAK